MLKHYLKCLGILIVLTTPILAYAEEKENPCDNQLALVNRPSVADSVCTVRFKKTMIEFGYQYQRNYLGDGYTHLFPNANLRFGLPLNNELSVLLPTFVHQTTALPSSGVTSSAVGWKHGFYSSQKLQTAAEIIVVPASGSNNFGSNRSGGTINGIANYNVTDSLGITIMMGVSVLAQPYNNGGQRYTSFNPDIIFSWGPNDKTSLYVELFGQSKTGPYQGAGFASDVGILYLIKKNIVVDAEIGQRISGQIGGFSTYFGTGMSIQF